MAPPKQLTTLFVLFIANTPSFVVTQSPYYFNPFQQQQPHQFQQNTYQPFTNAPTYYQPTYQSHSQGGDSGNLDLSSYFNGLPSPTPPASSPLVTYPTQVSTVGGAPGSGHHLSSPQVYQPVGNNYLTPTAPSTSTTDNNSHFRPSPVINHHTHIVNGLPRQQFFGNNYDFFRQRHGLTHLPTTSGPFLQHHHSNNPAPPLPSPTPSILLSHTSTSQPSRASETQTGTAKPVTVSSPRPTQPTIVSRFPSFNSLSPFSPAPSPATQTATTATPPRSFSTARPTSPSSSAVRVAPYSPTFSFSQFFPETDTNGSNELVRQPLFGDDEEEEVDDESYTINNSNNLYEEKRQQQQRPSPSPPPQIPYQRTASPPAIASPAPSPSSSPFKSQPFNNALNNVNTYNSPTKDEPTPVKVHNTTPIRIVFNYEQALEALEENPGLRVVVAHTEKNNLTQEESTTSRPAYSPVSTFTTPRPTTSKVLYQSTTGRPRETVTHRSVAAISSTQRPQPFPVSSNFDYQDYQQSPYSATGRTTTTAAALENLALELEGRYENTGRSTPRPNIRQTVATYVTEEPTYTETPLQTYRRGSKKYVAVQGGNVFKAQEPRVVVNDLADILVQPVPPGSRPYLTTQIQPTFSGIRPYSPTRSTFADSRPYSPTQSTFGDSQPYTPTQSTFEDSRPYSPTRSPFSTIRPYSPTQSTFSTIRPYSPTQTTFPVSPAYNEYDEIDDAAGQPVGEDLQQEIDNLSQQFEIATTIPTTTTTTTTPRPPPPPPRIRVTTPAPRLRITTYRPPGTYRTTPRQAPRVVEVENDVIEEIPGNGLAQEQPNSGRSLQSHYYYNNKQRGGLSGAYQRYEYNGLDSPPSSSQPSQEPKPVRRRQRVRGMRLIAGSPPRPVQVSGGVGPGLIGPMVVGPDGIIQPLQVGPVPFGGPLAQGSAAGPGVPGPVFRVGPRGRLLRRKVRPRTQQVTAAAPTTQESQPSFVSPSPTSPPPVPDLPPVRQEISFDGPSNLPAYSPTPFIPTSVPFAVTTFRPAQQNLLVQQNLVADEQDDDRRVVNTPTTFRSRFRYAPSRQTTTTAPARVEEEEEDESNEYEREEEAPPVPQRRRPQFSTTSTTEKPSSNQEDRQPALSDRANILQRQIRFNRNRKSNQRNSK